MNVLTPLQSTVESLTTTVTSWPGVLAVPVLAVAIWWLYVRTQQSDDPSGNMVIETDTGSVSVLISGAYWIALLVGLAAWLTWPLAMNEPVVGVVLLGMVGLAYALEKREAMD